MIFFLVAFFQFFDYVVDFFFFFDFLVWEGGRRENFPTFFDSGDFFFCFFVFAFLFWVKGRGIFFLVCFSIYFF